MTEAASKEKSNSVLSGRATRSDEKSTVAAHTPGRWQMLRGRTLLHIVGSDGHGICAVNTAPIGKDATGQERIAYRARAMADGSLISSAPDLLEALKHVERAMAADLGHTPLINIVRAAIAKAGA